MREIRLEDYARALGLHRTAGARRLTGLKQRKVAHGAHCVRLGEAIPTLLDRDRANLDCLFRASSVADPDSPAVDSDACEMATGLYSWLDEDGKTRADAARAHFVTSLASRMTSSAIFERVEPLRHAVIVTDPILPFVVLNDATSLPEMRLWAPAYAVANLPNIRQNQELAA